LRPVDNLALGPAFPVYPELARRIGVSQGSYLFKLPGYRCLNLSEFLGKCFELYRAHPESKPAVKGFLPLIEHAIAYVSSRK